MLKGGALIYALFVALIIGLTSSSLIFLAYFNRIEFQANTLKEKTLLDVSSGINLLVAQPEKIPFAQPAETTLFDDESSIVTLGRIHWGAFEIGVSKKTSKNYEFSQSVLIGSNLHQDSKISLYLADLDKPLSLCGKTEINGICYLPKAGVKRAYIEGQSFVGNKLINGEVLESSKSIPKINPEMLAHNQSYFERSFSKNDSVVSFEEIQEQHSIVNSFVNKPLLIYSEENIILTHQYYEGNIRIVSGKSVFIGAGSKLKDVIIYAPVIEAERDFEGNLQLFASDSLVIGDNCTFNYPSVVGLIKRQNKESATLLIKENTEINGVVFAYDEKPAGKSLLKVAIEKNATIKGQVYANGMVDLKGNIHGSLACNKFILNTPSSVYENHLLNVTIDYSKLSKHFVGVNLVNQSDTRNIVKWLY
ncbi:MAG: hypothetical protein COA57_04865 [Flavobacteriales bacterium]|nr:MAG: hypothetical protein COA57_04865 [Flavobacteriales bacterium]